MPTSGPPARPGLAPPSQAPGPAGAGGRRVLAVADDPALLTQLRKALEPLRPAWEVDTTRIGLDALDRMGDAPADTLVADARVAGTGTDEFLAEVRRRFPTTVRIALVAGNDQGTFLKLAAVAHRVLPKPLDPQALLDSIRRAHSLRELLWSPSLAAVVGRLGSVPALSALYNRIAEELSLPDFSLAAVGNLVEQDAGIAAKLIQVANSALLGLRRPAASPAQAVRVLGADLTRTLVLAADLFSRYDPAALRPFSIDALWEHSRKVAEAAARCRCRAGRSAAARTSSSTSANPSPRSSAFRSGSSPRTRSRACPDSR